MTKVSIRFHQDGRVITRKDSKEKTRKDGSKYVIKGGEFQISAIDLERTMQYDSSLPLRPVVNGFLRALFSLMTKSNGSVLRGNQRATFSITVDDKTFASDDAYKLFGFSDKLKVSCSVSSDKETKKKFRSFVHNAVNSVLKDIEPCSDDELDAEIEGTNVGNGVKAIDMTLEQISSSQGQNLHVAKE